MKLAQEHYFDAWWFIVWSAICFLSGAFWREIVSIPNWMWLFGEIKKFLYI